MNDQFSKPKGFGEILDHTFRLCKNHFSKLFLIFLIVVGPLYLLEALSLFASGTSFFRQIGSGSTWFEQIMSGYDEALYNTSLGADLLISMAMLVLVPVAYAATLFAIQMIKNNEEFTVSTVIKQAFSRFWPILGSSLLFGLIAFILLFALFVFIFIPSIIGGVIDLGLGIIMAIILFLGLGLLIAWLLTRWSFYLSVTVLEHDAPGLPRSFRLTRKNSWRILGLYIVLGLITIVIGVAIEGIFTFILGNSVLFTIIVNLVSLFTSMIFAVAYAVMYFDLKTRQDGDDLQEMIDDYNNQ
ncbi:hypothetical protein GMD78_09860 [Ornithinibacillus sp. L9]|uniref:DUF7847 domain-containing protein n=1 Tax=Ornithinibacillus caprae TaxID=2678566 RepID=A0A6N8FJ39_9BACI|nr:hypothetical protein [Ornithinibacillus caprae]MUK88696.1 hypothetical protein [Ornithinibacillus caprae]